MISVDLSDHFVIFTRIKAGGDRKFTGKSTTESTMVRYIDHIRNLIPGRQRPDNNLPPQGVTVDMGEFDYGKEQDKRKMSFYNPLDPVPKY